jgi:diguanylate cyclase (GGDEF)-like protein
VTPSKLVSDNSVNNDGPAHEFAVCITARDVTQLRVKTERLEHLAMRDPLTGALRRSSLVSELKSLLSSGNDLSCLPPVAVLAFNLHHFAVINGIFGRPIGDAVLKEITQRTRQFAGTKGFVARIDGNTFAVLLKDCPDQEHALLTYQALLEQVEQPITIESNHVQIRLNSGLAGSWIGVNGANELLAAAEAALDVSKQTNSGQLICFDPSLAGDASRALQIERHLWTAAERGELSVVFQPQVDLDTRKIIGAEALVRWENKELGKVSPAEFVPIAERSGAVQQIGKFVLWQACLIAANWPEDVTLAVNVSPLQFDLGDVDEMVGQILDDSGLAAERLHLELTETSLLTNRGSALKQINALRARGVRIALDDFGTGHSSFEYLANLPIDKIKVDQSFVRNIMTEPKARPIIYSMLILADGLGLKSVCEGIETEEQVAILKSAGCIEGQGYLFSKPIESDQFSKLILEERSRDDESTADKFGVSAVATRDSNLQLTGTQA